MENSNHPLQGSPQIQEIVAKFSQEPQQIQEIITKYLENYNLLKEAIINFHNLSLEDVQKVCEKFEATHEEMNDFIRKK